MRSAKERAAAAEAARQAAETRVQREADELRRAEAWEAEQREKAAAGLPKATAQPMVDNFADEVASYRSRARKNREVNFFLRYASFHCTLRGIDARPLILPSP